MEPRDFVKMIIGLVIGILFVFFVARDVICVSFPEFCLYGYAVVLFIIIVAVIGFYKMITAK